MKDVYHTSNNLEVNYLLDENDTLCMILANVKENEKYFNSAKHWKYKAKHWKYKRKIKKSWKDTSKYKVIAHEEKMKKEDDNVNTSLHILNYDEENYFKKIFKEAFITPIETWGSVTEFNISVACFFKVMNWSIRKSNIMKNHQNYRSACLRKQANMIKYELADYSNFSTNLYYLRDTRKLLQASQCAVLRVGRALKNIILVLCDVN